MLNTYYIHDKSLFKKSYSLVTTLHPSVLIHLSLFVLSCGTSSLECGGRLEYRSVFPTATLQMLRMATSAVPPIRTADSASSRCRGTAGYRLFPGCRAAVLRHNGMPGKQHTNTELESTLCFFLALPVCLL